MKYNDVIFLSYQPPLLWKQQQKQTKNRFIHIYWFFTKEYYHEQSHFHSVANLKNDKYSKSPNNKMKHNHND